MADIADIGFRADTSGLKDAKSDLDALSPAAARAERSSTKLSTTLGKVDAVADKLGAAAAGLVTAVDKLSAVMEGNSRSAVNAAASYGSLNVVAGKTSVTFNSVGSAASGATAALNSTDKAVDNLSTSMTQLDSHVAAYRTNLRQMKIDQMAWVQTGSQLDAHMVAYRDHLDRTGASGKAMGTAIKFGAQESLNASRQLADIGVTLAMGMNPLMVAIQQGPQLFDILQNKAVMTGQTIGSVFKAAGAAIWAAMAPILPIILAIAAAAAVVASGFALATRAINGNTKSITDGMGLTEKQLERVKKAGVDTSVTIGDTFKATFEVLGERLATLFDGPIKALSKAWNTALDGWTSGGRAMIKDLVGTFGGGYGAIVALWNNLPKSFSGIAALAGNAFISVFEGLINRILSQVNGINSKINEALKMVGANFQLAMFDPVKIGRIANAEAQATADAVSKGYSQGYAGAAKATDKFFSDVGKRARSNREKLIRDAAGKPDKDPKDKKNKVKKAADPFVPNGRESDLLDVDNPKNQLKIDPDVRSPIPIRGLDEALKRYRQGIEEAKEISRGFVDDLRNSLKSGEGFFKSFGNAVLNTLDRIATKLMDSALDSVFTSIFSGGGLGGKIAGLLGGGGKSLIDPGSYGGVALPGQKYAKGAAFSNAIIGQPTAFAFGKGGSNLGIMGEAGPEAVMPLQRGPDGSLGVQMYGGGSGGAGGTQRIEVALSVAAEEGDLFRPVVRQISRDEASGAVESGLQQYDAQMPARFQQIASDERVR